MPDYVVLMTRSGGVDCLNRDEYDKNRSSIDLHGEAENSYVWAMGVTAQDAFTAVAIATANRLNDSAIITKLLTQYLDHHDWQADDFGLSDRQLELLDSLLCQWNGPHGDHEPVLSPLVKVLVGKGKFEYLDPKDPDVRTLEAVHNVETDETCWVRKELKTLPENWRKGKPPAPENPDQLSIKEVL